MLSSFGTVSHEEEEDPSDQHPHQQINPSLPCGFTSSSTHMRRLLISCAELISQSDFTSAHRLVSLLSTTSSPYGDSTDRLVHQFSRALSLRLNSSAAAAASTSQNQNLLALQSSYLSLNQVTPFIRFSHLTANQAILEAIEGQHSIHILDFDTMHGVQWPPLMQAIAERSNPSNPPFIRITGTGHNLDTLRRTGDRLEKFAQSLGLRFQFHPLLLLNDDDVPLHLSSAVPLLPDETLAVNCVLYLHRFLRDDAGGDVIRLFLRSIKAMNPKVVAIAEREANHNNPIFLQRFVEALDHYTALFASLEATLPPNSQERLSVEQVWLGREILDIVCREGDQRRERHERLESWVDKLMTTGFSNVPLSPFALSQARLLLRLHYPSEGYQLKVLNDSFFLGWQNQALFSVSSWH